MSEVLHTVKRMRPLPYQPLGPVTITNFFKHVRKPPEGEDGCWIWIGGGTKKGYGRFKLNGHLESPHRVSYAQFRGEIPAGMYVLHRCDNPRCMNPNHLFLGTNSDNMKDCRDKGRLTAMTPEWKESRRTLNAGHVDAVKSLIHQGAQSLRDGEAAGRRSPNCFDIYESLPARVRQPAWPTAAPETHRGHSMTHSTADLDRLAIHDGVLLIAGLLFLIAGVGFAWICAYERWAGRFGKEGSDQEQEEIDRIENWLLRSEVDQPEVWDTTSKAMQPGFTDTTNRKQVHGCLC